MSNFTKESFFKIPAPVLVFSFLYLLVILFSRNVPMFWDMSNISWLSNLIFDNHFNRFIYPIADIDQGAMPLYSTYLAMLWVVFGKSLWVSHFAIFPFVTGIVYQFYKLSIRFFDKKYLWIALFLLFIEPTIFTQVFLSGMDIVFCYLFLFAVNSAIENKKIPLMVSLVLMPLLRLRGFTFVFSVFLIDIYWNYNLFGGFIPFIKKRLWIYFTPFLLLGIWFAYHYYETGWFLVSGNAKKFHHWASAERIFRNLGYIFWKIFDFGRIFLIVPIIIFFSKKERRHDKAGIQLLTILTFSILPYLIFFIPSTYPVSHRHFMIAFPVLIIGFVYCISLYPKNLRLILVILISTALLSGNLWLYPEKYGNGWDASMKSYPYFKLKNDFDQYIKDSKIDPGTVGAKAPMDFDLYFSHLAKEKFGYQYIDDQEIGTYNYIVQSNICNTFTTEEIRILENEWILEKELNSWPVYIRLYQRK